LAACSPKKTSEEYIQSAKVHVENGKSAAAILELKNAVSIDLKNPESRYLLGILYLELGDVAAAEKELTKSLELNGDVLLILPKLLKALDLQNKSEKLISLANQNLTVDKSVLPEILLYKALAYIKLSDKDKAKETITQANEVSSESVYSQLGEAYVMANTTDVSGALVLIENILSETPELTEALILKGQLLFSLGEYKNAIVAFNEYYTLLPKNTQIRLFLANSYVRNEQYIEAAEHLDFLLKKFPEHPFVNQLKGLFFYQKEDYVNALAHTTKAIQNGLDIRSNRVVAGLSAFKLEQYEQAHHFLITIADSLPSAHPVRKVLAIVQLQLGYNSEAGDTLQNMEGATAEDVNLLTTATFELLKIGKIQEAKALVQKTSDISDRNPQGIAKVGILKLSMNDLEGIADLEKATEMDSDLPIAKLALASAYIQNKKYDKALELAEKWKVSNPLQVDGFNLAAKVLLIQNKIKKAEQELKVALTINENNPYSRLYFANKFMLNMQAEKAIAHLEGIFSTSPEHLEALRLNYRVHKLLKIKGVKVAIDKIKQSYSNNSTNLDYRLLFARVLFIEEKFNEVIALLGKTSPIEWELLGDSYFKLDNYEKAISIYDDWIEARPQSRTARLRKVSTQEKLTDYRGALLTINEVLAKLPNDGQFNVLKVNFLILTKKFKQAEIQLNALTKDQRELPLVKGLQGQLLLTKGKFKEALSGLEGMYHLLPNSYNAALLFATHKKLDQDDLAFGFIEKHLETYPDDKVSRNILAENAIAYNLELSRKHYLVLLESTTDNFSILNNLAWVEYKLNNLVEANQLINEALKLNAIHPQALDTAGLIQLRLGNKDRAVEFLNRAQLLAPNDDDIAKHYKEALIQ
jgi:putative PEP-CTERM system TPR-repeat lipoprotein